MTQTQLVMSDIDGTILNKEMVLDKGLPTIVADLHQRHIPFVLNSARSPKGMATIINKLKNHDNPLSCFNGALILADSLSAQAEIIRSVEMEKQGVLTLLHTIRAKYPTMTVNLYSGYDWFVERMDAHVEKESERTQVMPTVTNLETIIQTSERPIHKLLLIDEANYMDQAVAEFEQGPFNQTTFYRAKPTYLEITHKDVSKGQALVAVAQYYDIPLAQTFAVGDNYNDMEMLQLAGIGVAMGNAYAEVKAIADHVTQTNDEEGASVAIKQFV